MYFSGAFTLSYQISYISNKPYYGNVLCTIVAEQLDSALGQAAHLNFASFGVSFCLWGMHYARDNNITTPAVGYEHTQGWLKVIIPLSTFASFLRHKCPKPGHCHPDPMFTWIYNFETLSLTCKTLRAAMLCVLYYPNRWGDTT